MKDTTRAFGLVIPTMALLIYFAVKDVIGIADLVLNVLFVGMVFSAFGVRWRHRLWAPQQTAAHERVRRMLSGVCLAATILAVATPVLSLATAYALKVQAPQYIEEAVVRTMGRPPAAIRVDTLNVSLPGSKSSESYVAVFQNNSENISPTRPVLKTVLGEVDRGVRAPAAWVCFVAVLILMIGLAVAETLADVMMASLNGSPASGASHAIP